MKTIFPAILFFLSACASPKPAPTGTLDSRTMNPDQLRIERAMHSETTAIVQDDDLELKADLKIPEIEIKLRKEEPPPKGLNARKGNVCVELKVRSRKSLNYAEANWTFLMTIDQKVAPTEAIVQKATQVDPATRASIAMPGETSATVCSKKTYAAVKHVILSVKEKLNPFAAFDWHQPWPPLRQSEN